MSKCTTGNRCVKCRKLNFKNAIKKYQKTVEYYLTESDKDEFGNLLIHPSKLQSLLNQRAKLGRIQRNMQNKIDLDKAEEKKKKESLRQRHMIRSWHENMPASEARDLAYWERNMLALRYADGWYYDTDNNWDGWKRVLSLDHGKITFHIPDDFPIGNLPEIEPNWDGHTTDMKWSKIEAYRGIETKKYMSKSIGAGV